MIDVQSKVRINGPVYHAANMVRTAVDAMATLLTGDQQYLWAQGSAMTDQRREAAARQSAQEAGEKKWET
jgi:hypothetical protein